MFIKKSVCASLTLGLFLSAMSVFAAPATPSELREATQQLNSISSSYLRRGSRGESVKRLQAALKAMGYKVTVDGDFGWGTLAVVQQLQKDLGVSADGVFGPGSLKAFKAHVSSKLKAAEEAAKPKPETKPETKPLTKPAAEEAKPEEPVTSRGLAGAIAEEVNGEKYTIPEAVKQLADVANRKYLKLGSEGPGVAALQKALGLEGDQITGKFDEATKKKLQDFQRSNRLSADGVVGPQTLSTLLDKKLDDVLKSGETLKQGSEGLEVLALQKELGLPTSKQTGVFDNDTVSALKAAQEKAKLPATGEFNEDSAKALDKPYEYAGLYDAYVSGRHIGKIRVVNISGKLVAEKNVEAWLKLKKEAAKAGVTLRLNSGFRTMSKQRYLYNLYRSGRGNLAARPGYSNHQNGRAFDIDVTATSAYRWMHKNAPKFGWRRTVPSEAWHWEYFGG